MRKENGIEKISSVETTPKPNEDLENPAFPQIHPKIEG